MSVGADIGMAAAKGLQKFGELEAQRRGGGGSSTGVSVADTIEKGAKLAAGDDKKIDKRSVSPRGSSGDIDVSGMNAADIINALPKRHTGGRIKKTGIYRLLKDEIVIPAHIVKRLDKSRKTSRKSRRS